MKTAQVLIIDDEESICWGLSSLCSELSFDSVAAASAEQGLEIAAESDFDLLIMDVRLPGIDGISAIPRFKLLDANLPIITITAFGELQTAVRAIQSGAYEYIVKPFDLKKVGDTIRQAIALRRLNEMPRTKQAFGRESMQDSPPADRLVGSSTIMQEVFKQIALTTTSDAPILITGEKGTGKELTARSIHQFGTRNSGPFVVADISRMPTSKIEECLFGNTASPGWFQRAGRGVLFINDISDLPIELQFKLLRVLETGEFHPTDSAKAMKAEFRLVTASHQDLLSQINHGDFRHDLFYRLRTFEIKLPPLRLRKEDIPELVVFFLRQTGNTAVSATEDFVSHLQSRRWPGNVQELQHVVAGAVELARKGMLTIDHLKPEPESTNAASSNHPDPTQQIQQLIANWTKRHWDDDSGRPLYDELIAMIELAILPQAFQLSDHQYSAAARRLGIHRTTLKKKLQEMGRSNL